MSKLAALLLPAIIVSSAQAQLGVDMFNLRMTAPAGSEFKYKVQMNLMMNGEEIKLRGYNVMKVVSVDANGDYSVDATIKDATVEMGGGEQAVPDNTATTKSNLKGEVLRVEANGEEAPAEGYRAPNIMSWSFEQSAYKVGDTITITRPASKTTGGVPSETVIKVVAYEEVLGIKAVKVEFSSKETSGDAPITFSGTGWIDPTVGMLVKMEGKFTNMLFAGAPMPFDGNLSYNLVPPSKG